MRLLRASGKAGRAKEAVALADQCGQNTAASPTERGEGTVSSKPDPVGGPHPASPTSGFHLPMTLWPSPGKPSWLSEVEPVYKLMLSPNPPIKAHLLKFAVEAGTSPAARSPLGTLNHSSGHTGTTHQCCSQPSPPGPRPWDTPGALPGAPSPYFSVFQSSTGL